MNRASPRCRSPVRRSWRAGEARSASAGDVPERRRVVRECESRCVPSGRNSLRQWTTCSRASGPPTRRQPSVAHSGAPPSTSPPASRLPSGEGATEPTSPSGESHWQPLAASDVEYLDPVGTLVGGGTERESPAASRPGGTPARAQRRQAQRALEAARAGRGPRSHRTPPPPRRADRPGRRRAPRRFAGWLPGAPGSAKERAELLSRLGVPDPDAALSCHRQPTSIG